MTIVMLLIIITAAFLIISLKGAASPGRIPGGAERRLDRDDGSSFDRHFRDDFSRMELSPHYSIDDNMGLGLSSALDDDWQKNWSTFDDDTFGSGGMGDDWDDSF